MNQPDDPVADIDGALSPADLARVIEAIDEAVALRRELRLPSGLRDQLGLWALAPPRLDMARHAAIVKALSDAEPNAPYWTKWPGSRTNLLKRLLNMMMRPFARPQRGLNEQMRVAMTDILEEQVRLTELVLAYQRLLAVELREIESRLMVRLSGEEGTPELGPNVVAD